MPLKLENAHPLEGNSIGKDTILEMVTAYRLEHSLDPHSLNFIHFNLQEVLQLFIDNGAIDSSVPLVDQMSYLKYWGLKIYLGYHTSTSNCPDDSGHNPNRYLKKDTAILCNTKLNTATKTWEDQITSDPAEGEKANYVSLLGAGDGLDRGSICPPNCPPTPDYAGYLHQDIAS